MSVRVIESTPREASRIVSSVMGSWHGYWAEAAASTRLGAALVALVAGRPAGAVVYYRIPSHGFEAVVIYYVAVLPWARRRGLGRLLVASAEEHAAITGRAERRVYMATIREGNVASASMFESLDYRVEPVEALAEERGWETARLVEAATCGYEDYYVAARAEPPGDPFSLLWAAEDSVWSVHEEVCVRPWLRLRREAPILRYR